VGAARKRIRRALAKAGERVAEKRNANRIAAVLKASGHAPNSAGEDTCSDSLYSFFGQMIFSNENYPAA